MAEENKSTEQEKDESDQMSQGELVDRLLVLLDGKKKTCHNLLRITLGSMQMPDLKKRDKPFVRFPGVLRASDQTAYAKAHTQADWTQSVAGLVELIYVCELMSAYVLSNYDALTRGHVLPANPRWLSQADKEIKEEIATAYGNPNRGLRRWVGAIAGMAAVPAAMYGLGESGSFDTGMYAVSATLGGVMGLGVEGLLSDREIKKTMEKMDPATARGMMKFSDDIKTLAKQGVEAFMQELEKRRKPAQHR